MAGLSQVFIFYTSVGSLFTVNRWKTFNSKNISHFSPLWSKTDWHFTNNGAEDVQIPLLRNTNHEKSMNEGSMKHVQLLWNVCMPWGYFTLMLKDYIM